MNNHMAAHGMWACEQVEALTILEPYLRNRHYRHGRVLWNEGEETGELVVLDRGRIKALRLLPDGTSVLLYVFFPGDIFGFLPLVDGGPYPAAAVAVDDVDVRVMSRSELRLAIERDPQVAMVLLAVLGKRLRQAFVRLGDQAQRSALTRVAAALSLLLPEGIETDSTTIIDIPSSIQVFSADVRMTPETFARSVTRLVEAGVLFRLGGSRLQILDARRLYDIASGKSLTL